MFHIGSYFTIRGKFVNITSIPKIFSNSRLSECLNFAERDDGPHNKCLKSACFRDLVDRAWLVSIVSFCDGQVIREQLCGHNSDQGG